MKAMRLDGVGRLFTREVDRPSPGPDELLIRVEACGVCGTDRHLFHGEFPCTPPVTLGQSDTPPARTRFASAAASCCSRVVIRASSARRAELLAACGRLI